MRTPPEVMARHEFNRNCIKPCWINQVLGPHAISCRCDSISKGIILEINAEDRCACLRVALLDVGEAVVVVIPVDPSLQAGALGLLDFVAFVIIGVRPDAVGAAAVRDRALITYRIGIDVPAEFFA